MKTSSINIGIPYQTLIDAIRQMKRKERETFMEDLLALTSPDYLESIREARSDYRNGRVKGHNIIFAKNNR